MKKIITTLLFLIALTQCAYANTVNVKNIGTIKFKDAIVKEIKVSENQPMFFVPYAKEVTEILINNEPFKNVKIYDKTDSKPDIYQIKIKRITGTYIANLIIKDLPNFKISNKKRKIKYSITKKEKQKEMDEVLEKLKIKDFKIIIMENGGWHKHEDFDGKIRWSLTSRVIISDKNFDKYPFWINANIYETENGYKLLLFSGSHLAAEYMDGMITNALYNKQRSDI